jgi:hypothetical protein
MAVGHQILESMEFLWLTGFLLPEVAEVLVVPVLVVPEAEVQFVLKALVDKAGFARVADHMPEVEAMEPALLEETAVFPTVDLRVGAVVQD